jgi:hypothetical protein
MKKILSFTLIALLTQMFFVRPIIAETKEEKFAAQVKTEIAKLGIGTDAKIKVKLKDKTKIEGYIVESNENQFVVMSSKTGESIPVTYSKVKQVKGNNLSTGVKIIIGVAVIVGLAVILLAVYSAQGGG